MYTAKSYTNDSDDSRNVSRVYVTFELEPDSFIDIMVITNDEYGRSYEYVMPTGMGYDVYTSDDITVDIPYDKELLYKLARKYLEENGVI